MAIAVATPPTGIAALSRAVVSTAADFVQTIEKAMLGEEKIRTAQRNAWDALCEDRARAQARAEMDAVVRAILAADLPQPAGVPARAAADRSRARSRRLATNAAGR